MRALHPVAGIEAHIAPALMHFAEQQQRQLAPVAIAQQNGHMRFTPHVKHFGVRLDDPPQNFTHVWSVVLDVSTQLICRLQGMDGRSSMTKLLIVATNTRRLLLERDKYQLTKKRVRKSRNPFRCRCDPHRLLFFRREVWALRIMRVCD